MNVPGPKAVSVSPDGQADGWEPTAGWFAEITPVGDTRLTVSVPADRLTKVHGALLRALTPPVSVLYRQKVNRRDPKPQGSPPRDFVARDVDLGRVVEACQTAGGLLYGDARCELWIQGELGERLILDEDGMLFAYPDDPAFRDALSLEGIPEQQVELISERDYVKHWFRAECDALEDGLVASLGLTEVPHRKG